MPGPAPYWTRERIIGAMQAYARRAGAAPSSRDWRKATGAADRLGPGHPASRPSYATVCRAFGSWSAALKAANLPARSTRWKQTRKQRCKHGHPLNDAHVTADGARVCRTCSKQHKRDYRQRRRTAQNLS